MVSTVANEIIGALSDRGTLQRIGEGLAEGLARSGNASAFSQFNPTGMGAGRAGGRGDASLAEERQALVDEIKARQIEHKYTTQISKSFKGLSKQLESSTVNLKEYRRQAMGFGKALEQELGQAMKEVAQGHRSEKNLIKNLNALLDEEVNSLEDVIKIQQRYERLTKRIMDKDAVVSNRALKEHAKLADALAKSTAGVKSWTESTLERLKSFGRTFFSFEAAVANATIALKQLATDFSAQLKFGSQLNVWTNQMTAMMAGVDPGALTELLAESRMASLTF